MMLACDNRQEIVSQQSLLNPEDFALNMIGGLIKSGITDAKAIENKINEGATNPYNNVDIDKDGSRDYVMVKETNPKRQFDFVAKVSGTGQEQHIATMEFTDENGQPAMNANYTSAVHGYQNHYYHDTFTRDLLFFAWMHSMTRPAYVGFVPTTYSYSRVVPRTQFASTQRTYQTTTKINPTPVQKPPANYSASKFVNKSNPSGSLGSAAKSVKSDFRTNNNSVKPKGAAFDNTPKSNYRPSTPSYKPSSGSSYKPSSGSSFRSSGSSFRSSGSSFRSRGR
jgi:hypothetical protein